MTCSGLGGLSYNGNLSKKEISWLFSTIFLIAWLFVYLNLFLRYKNNSEPSNFTVNSILCSYGAGLRPAPV